MNSKTRYQLIRFVNLLESKDIAVLRLSLIIIFGLFGTYKWFDFEVKILDELLSGTWLSILHTFFGLHGGSYFLGIMENITLIALIVGFFRPIYGAVGAVLVILTGLVTLSLLPQLGKIDAFIIKDVLLVGAGLVLLRYDLQKFLSPHILSTTESESKK
ncbi:TPA: DUF417 family protein [Escherichia coli]|nr:DUF417 family protein [Escherichia coli]